MKKKKKKKKITDYYPMVDNKYLCLENNKTYTNPRTITNLLFKKYNMTAFEYAIKWNLIDNDDYVICKKCGSPCDSIGKHLSVKHKNYGGVEQYKKDYGENIKLISDNYKKFLTNKMTGKNNPNHSNNTTLLERQQKSPFSIEFWKLKYPKYSDKRLNELLTVFRDSALSDREFDTRLDYYIKRGYSEDEGLELIKKRQTTFSKELCIEKYGETEGLIKWSNRQEKWIDSLLKNGNMHRGYSKISQKLFDLLFEASGYDMNFKYATNGKEFKLKCNKNNMTYLFDFVDTKNKKIIEFNGDAFHGNPNIYKPTDTPHPFNKTILAKDMWNKDNIKYNCAKNLGYDVLVIWESEFKAKGKKNTKKVIDKCLDFIYN